MGNDKPFTKDQNDSRNQSKSPGNNSENPFRITTEQRGVNGANNKNPFSIKTETFTKDGNKK